MKRGDVIIEVNRKSVHNLSEYDAVIRKVKSDGTILLLVHRNRTSIYIAVR